MQRELLLYKTSFIHSDGVVAWPGWHTASFYPKPTAVSFLKKLTDGCELYRIFWWKKRRISTVERRQVFFFLHIRWASRATWKRKRKKPMNPVRRGNSGPPTSLVNNATSQRPEIKTDNYHRTDGCTINTNLMMSKGVTWTSVHSLFIHSWITAKSTRWCEMTHLSGFFPPSIKGIAIRPDVPRWVRQKKIQSTFM